MTRRDVDVYAIGTSLPVLAAALDLAEVGLSVRIAAGSSGEGLPARGVRDPEGAIASLLEHVAAPLGDRVRSDEALHATKHEPAPLLLRGPKGEWLPQPVPSVSGIPGVAVSREALALLGGGAATRGYLDRVAPLLTIGKTHELGRLVRSRLGKGVLDRLVAPVVRERFGVSPDEVDAAVAAPGLNEALTMAGSLAGAVQMQSERDVARETTIAPAAGWERLREALLQRLALYDVEFAGAPSTVEQTDDGWRCREPGAPADTGGSAGSSDAAGSNARPGSDIQPDSNARPGSNGDAAGPGAEVIARLVLADPGFEGGAPLPEGLSTPAAELRPAGWRAALTAETIAHELPAGTEALQTVVHDGSPWSVRIVAPVDPDADRVQLQSSAGGVDEAPSGAALPARVFALGPVVEQEEARAMLDTGAELLEDTAPARGGIAGRLVAAPSATLAQRHDAAQRLAAWRERNPELLLVGPSLHGGELSEAIADARSEAVQHRRSLTGISD